MAPGFLARFSGGGGSQQSTLQADLKKITESGVIEIPKELLDTVVEAALGEDDRRAIMRHLRECLSEPTVKRWRRVYAALILTEELAKRGPSELMVETAHGHHFDVVQRLSMLEKYENTGDKRVQNMICAKASALRSEMVVRLQAAGDEEVAKDGIRDTTSTCSPDSGSCSTATSSNAGSGAGSNIGSGRTSPANSNPTSIEWSDPAPVSKRPKGMLVLNGIVSVGHNDDTTDEECSDDEGARKAAKQRQRRKAREASEERRPAAQALAAPAPPPTMDLLDL
mmetsp:Transcript_84661/g.272826  ORF Transcript_84661/g.272826 Transcript_84661/m.272826 type:complete len:282 (-) Transcript_84661:69-914(-)|eukprot:CAMPEP_0203989070 /NCGR_PEP_ID=MMETSP0360-20130528/7858_1 /ASSEMBLY_ACC=CAM_ASM_000342 /TAXON_ID=268821 /ORGANISM="Scrippsiella Hangoei, Strain SHTV-5" /LENGTH=281 /DNA_ID=CAMNT_0050928917 /DNA_START=66 /DNA_END=911 /DNA_ORIENTATION=-